MDLKVRELTVIALVSLFSLGLAWAYEADLFAMFFAAAAAIAGVEAVRLEAWRFLAVAGPDGAVAVEGRCIEQH